MSFAPVHPHASRRRGEPVWEIAELFPEQGLWTEQQYLSLKTNRLVEFDNGIVEVLPVPTKTHQLIALFLYEMLRAFITSTSRGGVLLVAPYRLRMPSGQFREPDLLYMTTDQNARAGEAFAESAEVVMEVVSPDDPDRDYVTKRREYATAGIPEYWIVDPAAKVVVLLRLVRDQYMEHGRFGIGQQATSEILPGFSIVVDDVMSQGR